MDVRDVLSFASPSPQIHRSMKPPPPPSLSDTISLETDVKRPRIYPETSSSNSESPSDPALSGGDTAARHPIAGSSTTEVDDEDDGIPTTVGASEVDESTIRRLTLLLEKRALVNQEARTKFPDQPKRFMQSEVDLQETLEEMQILAANPSLYPVLAAQTRPISLLLGLLAHENTDISLSVIDLLHELLEPNGLTEAGPSRVNPLLDLLFNGQLIQLLMQNVSRLDETKKDEADGVHKTLGIVENLLDVRPEMNVTMSNQGLFSWLLRRIQRKPAFDRNKLYVSELLSILLQLDETNRRHLGQVDGIDILLQQLAVYKRHDPASREEMELMHNLFDCLCSALMLPENKDRFLKGEGIQLMNLMLREKHMSRDSALRVLDYALCLVAPTSTASASSSTENDPEMPTKSSMNADPEAVVVANCSKFVEVLGLRTIFPLFMHSPRERLAPGSIGSGMKKKTLGGPSAAEMEEHIINIIGALLRHCPSALKSRLLAKFVESDHEKVDRLVELHLKYFSQVKSVDSRIRAMREDKQRWTGYTPEEIEDELMVEHLSSGLLALQMLDIIALDICVNGAPTIMDRLLQLLKMRSVSPRTIVQVVQDHVDSLGEAVTAESEKFRLNDLIRTFTAKLP
ncbi:Beta catenin protein 1 [Fasciola hepatica]|uniref:Beta-catenin-like protein 1 n=1 Tax=Fasciola hepatica TaxID=6192 RepID=A0A4E0RLV4_FASHE|nr:Beta catenin protein 1 [Fasciola hepatica]